MQSHTTKQRTTANAKKRFLVALEERHGNVRAAAIAAKVGRRSVYRWFDDDAEFRREMAIRFLILADEIQDAALDVAARKRRDGLVLTLAIQNDRYSFGLVEQPAVQRLGIHVTDDELKRDQTERELLRAESPSSTRRALSRLRKRNSVLAAIVNPPRRWRPRYLTSAPSVVAHFPTRT